MKNVSVYVSVCACKESFRHLHSSVEWAGTGSGVE